MQKFRRKRGSSFFLFFKYLEIIFVELVELIELVGFGVKGVIETSSSNLIGKKINGENFDDPPLGPPSSK